MRVDRSARRSSTGSSTAGTHMGQIAYGDLVGDHRKGRAWAWMGALLLVAAATGCSNGSADPSPPPTAPGSRASTTTTSSAPVAAPSTNAAPTLPAAAQQPTRDGAVAFVRYYIDLYNYAFKSLDPSPLIPISGPDCIFCKSVIQNVSDVRSKQEHTEGGRLVVVGAVASPGTPSQGILVATSVDQEAGKTLKADDTVAGVVAAHRGFAIDTAVHWKDGGWIMLAGDIKDKR